MGFLRIGSGMCNDSSDISGYIVDDNNGFLVKGREYINTSNLQLIGANLGYIRFKDIPKWQNIPNGSLIVIIDEENQSGYSLDPDDSNHDFIYVLNVNDTSSFVAFENQWDESTDQLIYSLTDSSLFSQWTTISFNNVLDGVQTRYPDGSYHHGIGWGQSLHCVDPIINTHLGYPSDTLIGYSFKEGDFHQPSNFEESSFITPGAGNSQQNSLYISKLISCPIPIEGEEINDRQIDLNTIMVYPNPNEGWFFMDLLSNKEGIANVSVYTIQSKIVAIKTIHFDQTLKLETSISLEDLSPSTYFLKVQFPDGKSKFQKIVVIPSH